MSTVRLLSNSNSYEIYCISRRSIVKYVGNNMQVWNKDTGTEVIYTKLYYKIFGTCEVLVSGKDKYFFKELRGVQEMRSHKWVIKL